jgi:hypothetical protein
MIRRSHASGAWPAWARRVTYAKLPYDFIRDIAPVAGIIRFPNIMEVNPSEHASRHRRSAQPRDQREKRFA